MSAALSIQKSEKNVNSPRKMKIDSMRKGGEQ